MAVVVVVVDVALDAAASRSATALGALWYVLIRFHPPIDSKC